MKYSYLFILTSILINSCQEKKESYIDTNNQTSNHIIVTKEVNPIFIPTKEFKDYWFAGEGEITSYKLEQARYGEIREGEAVMVYVTEDFLPDIQVKTDNYNKNNIKVLKLNALKNFNTGIYPYSIMQSTFYPISNNQHAIKVSCSVQEWCGHAYTQLNNKQQFDVDSHSYFESESDKNFSLEKSILENELWTQLRIDPKSLPIGNLKIIPSFEFLRLRHVPLKAYEANVEITDSVYSISYPELDRTLKIVYNNVFPFEILSWEETFKSGFGPNSKILTTKATRLKTIKSAYWEKNSNVDESLRETLLLK
jgi:hypothetical protein